MFVHLDTLTPLDMKSVDGAKGRHYTTPTGNRYPSITTILGHGEKEWLNDWRNSLGQKAADAEVKRATERGTAVHLMLERQIQNELDPTKDQKVSHIAEFNSLRFQIKKLNNIMLQEAALYSDIMKVAGRVDCVAEYDGVLSIIDFKTATRYKSSDMINDYFLQTTAYALMIDEMYDLPIQNIVIIMSVEQGLPLLFKGNVDDYVEPLIKRINKYHTQKKELTNGFTKR